MDLKKIAKEILSQSYNITTEAGEELVVIESRDVFDILNRLASDGVSADINGEKEYILKEGDISCRASFRGTVTREQLYIILEYMDDMKQRGFQMVKHDRTDDMLTGNVNIEYVLEKHGS